MVLVPGRSLWRVDVQRRVNLAWFRGKDGKSGSTSGGKSGRLKEQNERRNQSGNRPESLGQESRDVGADISRRLAEEGKSGRSVSSGRSADERSLKESHALNHADQDAIARIRESSPELIHNPSPDLKDKGGAEQEMRMFRYCSGGEKPSGKENGAHVSAAGSGRARFCHGG